MIKNLTKTESKTWYFKNGIKIFGVHKDISGNVTDLSGNVSNIWGDVTNIRGYVSNLSGDLDECNISSEDRAEGINIEELVK